MQRKIGYGLIGVSVALILLLGMGVAWRAAIQVTNAPLETEVVAEQIEPVSEKVNDVVLPPPLLNVVPIILPVEDLEEQTQESADDLPVLTAEEEIAQLFGETNDTEQIMQAVAILVEREQEILIPEGGWYHFESTYFWADETISQSTDDYRTADENVIIPHGRIIPQVAWSNSYIRYNSDKQVREGISILGEFETKAIKQLSIVDEGSWVNLTLQQLGDPHHYGSISSQPFTFPTQERRRDLASLNSYPDFLEMSAYTNEEGQYVIDVLFYFPTPHSARHDESVLVVAKREEIVFDIATGQHITREGYLIFDDGQEVLDFSEMTLAQQVVQELPPDVAALYEQSKPKP